MKRFTFAILAIICLQIIGESRAEFVKVGLKTYYVERTLELTWHDAWNYCAANNMKLASVETDLETRLLEPILKNNAKKEYWISGNELAAPSQGKDNRKFVWGNLGRPITYTNWSGGQPDNYTKNEFCIHIQPDMKWNDLDCSHKRYFVCEA